MWWLHIITDDDDDDDDDDDGGFSFHKNASICKARFPARGNGFCQAGQHPAAHRAIPP